jgi:hypothetical protein
MLRLRMRLCRKILAAQLELLSHSCGPDSDTRAKTRRRAQTATSLPSTTQLTSSIQLAKCHTARQRHTACQLLQSLPTVYSLPLPHSSLMVYRSPTATHLANCYPTCHLSPRLLQIIHCHSAPSPTNLIASWACD